MSGTPPEDRSTLSLFEYILVLGYLPHMARAKCSRDLWSGYRMPWEDWESARLAACTQEDRDHA
jgi:hypothetical protein